ncbi:hypothetical protein PMIN02_010487 [Paraphaeosphaeria minitans]
MGLGVFNDPHMTSPPGTYTIGVDNEQANDSSLKRDGDIILQPQPSEDPNDPLNWSRAWKESILLILAFASGVTTALGLMVTPGLQVIVLNYKVSIDLASSLIIGIFAFWVGATTFFTASGANIRGKRPFLFISSVILLLTCIWGQMIGTVHSFPQLATMRIIQGIASAPLETLVTSTVSDLFFVPQRGTRLSIWDMMLGSGVLLGQTISGAIIQNLSFESTFGITAIMYILILFGLYFVVVETTYNGTCNCEFKTQIEEKGSFEIDTSEKQSYCGMADWATKAMAHRNKGVFEPEFRLVLMLIAVPFATVGFIGFGYSLHNAASIYQVMAFFSIYSFSVPIANQAFVTINFTKAIFTFLATTYANEWMMQVGPKTVFVALAMINLGVCEMTIPAYVFGKRFRSMVARSSFGQKMSR